MGVMSYLDFFAFPLSDDAVVVLSATIGVAGMGVALAYFIGDMRSPATRALAFAVAMVGVANAAYPAQHVLHPDGRGMWWLVAWPVLDAMVMVGLCLWMLRIVRTAQPSPRALRWVHRCAWAFAAVTACYLVLGGFYPVERMTRFLFCMGHPMGCSGPYFWTFAVPISLMGSLLVAVGLIVFSQRIDAAERERVVCVALATPFFFANYVLPAGYNVMTSLPGLFIFLVGGVRYHTVQGERGQFLSRFLSREVVREVTLRGLSYTMQPRKLELTVVCVDLRGFTHFSTEHDSAEVTRLLGEYYEAVGQVVSDFQATIQDYAGDGIMILLGAPLPMPDHAQRGLALGQRILATSQGITTRWAKPNAPLSVGVGIASGVVTVGAIGSASRMEYTAIGSAANLASRLCDIARGGEILIDLRTVELAGATGLEVRAPVPVKGMGEVAHFAALPGA